MKKDVSFIPYIIIAVIVLFSAFIGSFVYRSMFNETQLVTDNYYQEEISFQEKINKKQNALSIEEQLSFQVKESILHFSFPDGWKGIKGNAYLYNPVDSKQDVSLPFKTSDSNLKLNLKELSSGFWTFKLDFEYDGIPYYIERKVYL